MSDSLYIALYYNLLLLFVIFVSLLPLKSSTVKRPYLDNQILSIILLLLVFVHITFRSTDYHFFGDTASYARSFRLKAAYGKLAIGEKDIGFEYLSYWLSQIVSLRVYWFILCCLYVLPVFFAFKKRIKEQYFIAFLFFVCSMSFWGYGVNGLRNGIATSLVLCSFLITDSDLNRLPIWIIACLFHQSVLLPVICFLLAGVFKNSKYYLAIWLVILLIVIFAQEGISDFIKNIPWFAQDERMSNYLNMSTKGMGDMFARTGFRWDFLIYSAIPIYAGWKYSYRLNYDDKLYTRIFNTYLAANAFWLLTIYVPYTNRFAYLSWFLYPVVIIYPLLKQDLIKGQGSRIQIFILIYYLFTYIMWLK